MVHHSAVNSLFRPTGRLVATLVVAEFKPQSSQANPCLFAEPFQDQKIHQLLLIKLPGGCDQPLCRPVN